MMDSLIILLYQLQHNAYYSIFLFFVGAFPLFGSIVWISGALFFWARRERNIVEHEVPAYFPKVSIVLSAYNEEKYLHHTLESLHAIDYPDYEIVVVNDGSKDNTLQVLEKYASRYNIRVIDKKINQGKAMAMNDALMCLNGEIILFLDADAEVNPDILCHVVPHFMAPDVGAVGGNPQIKNTKNFLARLQLLEYSTVIGMIRRSQRIWGSIMSVSGVIFAVRKSALLDVGGFSPAAATEDTDLTWRLQKRFWDVRYEPNAVAWVITPTTYRSLFKQRLRWTRGLMYVLHTNVDVLLKWKYRRMLPVFIEETFAAVWSLCAAIAIILWVLSAIARFPLMGISPIPAVWGMAIAFLCLIQQAVAVAIDRQYNPSLPRFLPYAIFYPIYYWVFLTIVSVLSLPAIFKKPNVRSYWMPDRG